MEGDFFMALYRQLQLSFWRDGFIMDLTPEARLNHRPMLSDLRESGSLEQDADVVMFLYRDAYYNRNTEDKDVIENIIAKNRNGQVGIVKLKWVPQYQLVE